ncbi:MAG: hypothetical protein ACPF9D_00010 [Owenweeksia sp.]
MFKIRPSALVGVLFVLLWLVSSTLYAQTPQSSAASDFMEKPVSFESIDELLNEILLWPQSGNLEQKKETTLPILLKKASGLDSAALRAYFYEAMTVAYYQALGDLKGAHKMILKEIDALQEFSAPVDKLAPAYSRLMFILVDLNETEKAYETSLQLKEMLPGIEDSYVKSFSLRQLCAFYQRTRDLDDAAKTCTEAIQYNKSEDITYLMGGLYETLALVATSGKADADSILRLRRQAIRYDLINGDSLDLRVVYRNMALTFESIGQPDSAEYYFRKTFEIYNRHPYFLGWVQDQTSYGSLLLNRGKPTLVKPILDTVESVVKQHLEKHLNSLISLAKLQSRYYAYTGAYDRFREADNRADSLELLEQEEREVEVREEMMARYEADKKEAENQLLKARNKARSRDVWFLVILCSLLFLLSLLLIQRRGKDKKIHLQKMQLSQMEANAIKIRMEGLRSDLEERVKQVMVQQAHNTELKELIEELQATTDSLSVKKKASQMKRHINMRIEEDTLIEIDDKMGQLYPRLYSYLKDNIGASRRNEILSTAMYFMGYETRDIATLLQRTEKAIRSMRYRVRKKLDLTDTDDLLDFLKQKQDELN